MKGYTVVPNYQLQHVLAKLQSWEMSGVPVDPLSSEFNSLVKTVGSLLTVPIASPLWRPIKKNSRSGGLARPGMSRSPETFEYTSTT